MESDLPNGSLSFSVFISFKSATRKIYISSLENNYKLQKTFRLKDNNHKVTNGNISRNQALNSNKSWRQLCADTKSMCNAWPHKDTVNTYAPVLTATQTVLWISVQLLSWIWLFVTHGLQHPGSPVLHHLPEFAQIHVQWVSVSS